MIEEEDGDGEDAQTQLGVPGLPGLPSGRSSTASRKGWEA